MDALDLSAEHCRQLTGNYKVAVRAETGRELSLIPLA
jgi:hypothetical protein